MVDYLLFAYLLFSTSLNYKQSLTPNPTFFNYPDLILNIPPQLKQTKSSKKNHLNLYIHLLNRDNGDLNYGEPIFDRRKSWLDLKYHDSEKKTKSEKKAFDQNPPLTGNIHTKPRKMVIITSNETDTRQQTQNF